MPPTESKSRKSSSRLKILEWAPFLPCADESPTRCFPRSPPCVHCGMETGTSDKCSPQARIARHSAPANCYLSSPSPKHDPLLPEPSLRVRLTRLLLVWLDDASRAPPRCGRADTRARQEADEAAWHERCHQRSQGRDACSTEKSHGCSGQQREGTVS